MKTGPATSQGRHAFGTSYSWYVVFIMMLAYMLNIGDRYILATVVEPIKAELHLSDTYIGALTGFSFAMLYGLCALFIAVLADRGNRRNIVTASVVVFSLMTAACGIAQNYVQLVLARMGVAFGESGTTPPSHSLISDLFPATKRALPLAVVALGASIGTWYGFSAGSFLAQLYGWRSPFILLAIPGLILGLIMRVTVKEPERGRQDGVSSEATRVVPSFWSTMRFMWSQTTLRNVLIGSALVNFYGYAMALWNAAFMARSLGMSISEAGNSLGVWYALIGGNGGILLGGYLTEKLGERNIRWHARTTSLMLLLTFIPIVGVYLVPLGWQFNLCNVALGIAMHGYLGGVFSMTQNLVAIRMRAVACAVLVSSMNVVGLGFGPLAVGALSDYLTKYTHAGVDALRYALISSTLVLPWAALHFFLAERNLKGDYETALHYDGSEKERLAHAAAGTER